MKQGSDPAYFIGSEVPLNDIAGDSDELMRIVEGFEDKLLERGSLNEFVNVSSFDFSIHVCDLNDDSFLGIDIFSDEDEFDAENIDFKGVFTVVIDGLEDRRFFGACYSIIGKPLNTEFALCLSEGYLVKAIGYV
jgi:hypothetical protein